MYNLVSENGIGGNRGIGLSVELNRFFSILSYTICESGVDLRYHLSPNIAKIDCHDHYF